METKNSECISLSFIATDIRLKKRFLKAFSGHNFFMSFT